MTKLDVIKDEIKGEIECYICGLDLLIPTKIRDRDNSINIQNKKFPSMVLWNGLKKELCLSCHKNHIDGMKIYQENNPNWENTKVKRL